MAITEIGDYQGKPVIVIKSKADDQYPLTLGVLKAKKVLGAIEELKAFVKLHDRPYQPSAGRGQSREEAPSQRRGEERRPDAEAQGRGTEQPRASEGRSTTAEIPLDGVRGSYTEEAGR